MKYTRLTKEQFLELHQEFIRFLASQSITQQEWQDIKTNTPEVAEQELDVFSDTIWEKVLTNVNYIDHISSQYIHLFSFNDDDQQLITVKLDNNTIDLTSKEGFEWLQANILSDSIEILTARKSYSHDKLLDKFKIIQQGGVITKGALFQYFNEYIN